MEVCWSSESSLCQVSLQVPLSPWWHWCLIVGPSGAAMEPGSGAWMLFKQQQFWGPGCWPAQSSAQDAHAQAQAVALRSRVWVHVEQPHLWSPRRVLLVRGAPGPGAAPSGGCTGLCPSLRVTAVMRAVEVCSGVGCRRVLHSKPLETTMAPVVWLVLKPSAFFFVAGHLMSQPSTSPQQCVAVVSQLDS